MFGVKIVAAMVAAQTVLVFVFGMLEFFKGDDDGSSQRS
jgi:hypothetical protein